MKRYVAIFTVVSMAFLIVHCTRGDEVSQSYRATSNEIEAALKDMVGKDGLAKIASVKYLEGKRQCVSLVSYTLNGKLYENVAIAKGKGTITANNNTFDIESDDDNGGTRIRCTGSCDGGSGGCTVIGTIELGTGDTVMECSCEGCKMEVK